MLPLSDPWHPRAREWLEREPSPYAGCAGRPLIIGGCPRSGTTLLRSILDNHPEIAVPAETNFALPLWHARSRFGDLRRPQARRAVADFVFSPGRGGRKLRGDVPRKEAVARVVAAPPTLGSLIAACFALYAERTGKPRWGDKRPRYATHLPAVFALFPNAQFVNVVRDPRAAVASQIPMGWDAPEVALPGSIANWCHAVERVDRFARRLRPDQLLDVRYEDLARDPEREIERVCAFAGLAGGPVAAQAVAAPRRGKRFRPDSHHRVRQPVTADRITSWQDRLAPADAALVEHVTGPWFERFGYVAVTEASVERAARREVARQLRVRRSRMRRVAARELARRVALDRREVAAVAGPTSY